MRNIATVAQREFASYFLSPVAYAVMAIFLFAAGLAFGLGNFRTGQEASLRPTIEFWMILILVFVLPMLTMRLISEELRSGTIETLLTVPVSEAEVVLGKFLGGFFFFLALLAATLLYPLILSMFGNLDLGLLACHYFGLLLLGSLYVAVGLFFSSLTRHQVVAVLAACALLALMTFAASGLATRVEGRLKAVLQQLSIQSHFVDFARGLVDLNHLVFFLTMTGFFLFLTVRVLETRRWQ